MPVKVAIVEDLDEVREGLAQFISTDPFFEVQQCCNNATDAIDTLPILQPDIVIMDINLPGMSGTKCIQKIKPEMADTKFMMFTVHENDDNVFEALKAGASGYLLKKTSPAIIIESLKELYNGGSPMSANIANKLVRLFQKQSNKGEETLAQLSPREREVLQWLSHGLLYKEIGEKLAISTGTVRQHIHKIYEKLHVQNRTEALNKYFGH
jgi:DNA-binding NarL/FixJ family response regulator